MDNSSKPNLDDENPDAMTDSHQRDPIDGIFGIPNLFNSGNFAQASIISNNAEDTITSPIPAYTSIFSDIPNSTNISPISAQTSIFSNVSNSNLTSPISVQANVFSNAPNSTNTSPKSIQPITPTPEVDLNAHDTDPDPDLDENSGNGSSRSISSSPEAPDFNALAVSAPETLSLFSNYRSPLSSKWGMPKSLYEFNIMYSSTKRNAAIKGQAQRIGAVGADKDDSGTYDPSLERKRNTRSTKAKKAKENGGGEGASKTSVGTRSGRKTKQQGSFQWIITIRLKSEEGLKYLRKITPGPEGDESILSRIHEVDDEDSGDDDDIKYPTHSTRRKKIKTSHNRRSDGLTLEDLTIGHPQRRGCKSCFEAGDDECSLIEFRHEWPCEACEAAGNDCELIIPPELKLSCTRCKEKLRRRCSYADDAGKGVEACKACEEANVKCIAGPKADSGTSMRMTEVLANVGVKKRGSLKGEGVKKVLPATATDVPKTQAMARKYVACNRCREQFKGKCSIKRGEEGPCNRCVKANEPCTFTFLPTIPPITSNAPAESTGKDKGKEKGKGKDISPAFASAEDLTQTIILESTKLNDCVWRTTHPQARRTKAQQKAFERAQHSHSPSVGFLPAKPITHPNSQKHISQTHTASQKPHTPMHLGLPQNFTLSHNGIRTITITTAFSHPIIFNYIRDPMYLYPPCTFHTNPFFGLFGFGPRLVTVVPWPSITGAGYEELENGHGDSEAGEDKTRMCVKCTYDRVKILGCPEHILWPLGGVDQRMWDDQIVQDSVRACEQGLERGRWGRGKGGEPERGSRAELVWRAKWCAVCPSPAAWICDYSEMSADSSQGMDNGRRAASNTSQRSDRGKKGCGLLLCDTCHDLHTKIQKGGKKGGMAVLGRVIHLAGDASRKEYYPDGVRADAGFLREDGELFVRTKMGGCGASKGGEEGSSGSMLGGGDGRGRGAGGLDGVVSSEMGRAGLNSLGKGVGIDRFAISGPTTRGDNISGDKSKGKGIDQIRPRHLLDSMVLGNEVASGTKRKGKGDGINRFRKFTDEDEDSEYEVAIQGTTKDAMVTAAAVRETPRGNEVFPSTLTGDGNNSGRWKGKSVDRKTKTNINSNVNGEMGLGLCNVMRSIERDIIELSD
ncbi:hypothetical protein SBOR_3864 [Sclerotinia borealis F-4128]|uniref:Zn(2)-C6 fungal-type domain-containing protein n=1 Tax=Sclerotinia borealis (strain F-4128) TaxID=1432307 RepID=W9CG93_SCLBF|nr:hypothetical protein SBOR_3864 [Sclerotinia borealis F-4128]